MMNHDLLRQDIRKLKFIKGLSYQELADMTNSSYWTIAGYMSGHDTSNKLALRIIKALRLRIEKYEDNDG